MAAWSGISRLANCRASTGEAVGIRVVNFGEKARQRDGPKLAAFPDTIIEDCKQADGQHFGERKHWLQDAYVKFIRLSESLIGKNG